MTNVDALHPASSFEKHQTINNFITKEKKKKKNLPNVDKFLRKSHDRTSISRNLTRILSPNTIQSLHQIH